MLIQGRKYVGKCCRLFPFKGIIDGITDNVADLLDLIVHILARHIHIIEFSQTGQKLILYIQRLLSRLAHHLIKGVADNGRRIHHRGYPDGDDRNPQGFLRNGVSVIPHSGARMNSVFVT